MKISVAADSSSSDAQVSTHAARAPFYLLYDDHGTFLDAIENPYSLVERGAAPGALQLLQQHGVTMLIAMEFGDRFMDLLEQSNISTVIANGSADRIIQEMLV